MTQGNVLDSVELDESIGRILSRHQSVEVALAECRVRSAAGKRDVPTNDDRVASSLFRKNDARNPSILNIGEH
jgi:hypothetical protein